tara:strand:+ start:3398 stop:3652 length:255 start_codon:yes stop_codon:yes gene_type:complete
MSDDIVDLKGEAEQNQRMLEDPIFNKAFESMNADIMNQILQTPPEAKEERERLYMMFKSGQLFVQQFANRISDFNRELQSQPDS